MARLNPYRVRRIKAMVGERDGWLCYRCGQHVDQSIRHPHPWSATLEHDPPIVELDERGLDPYDPLFCHVSHHRCNTRAGRQLGVQREAARMNDQPIEARKTALTW